MIDKRTISEITYTKVYRPSKLHRRMKLLNTIMTDFVTAEKEFPTFSEFVDYLPDDEKTFSIADGIATLQRYYSDVPLTHKEIAQTQTKNQEKRDLNGLLGKTVTRPKDPQKIHKKKVQSVWTVKKK